MWAECITVPPTDALKSVKREYRSRRKGCYVLQDKYHEYLIVAHKAQRDYLNSIAVDQRGMA